MKTIHILIVLLLISFLNQAQTWTQKTNFGGSSRWCSVSFVINGIPYTGLGSGNSDFWKYDPVTDSWTQVASGFGYDCPFAFAIGDNGYVGGGAAGHIFSNFYCYNSNSNSWTQKANLPYPTVNAIGFSIAGRGYFGTGHDDSNNIHNQIYEYDPIADLWTFKSTYPGGNRQMSSVFVIDTAAYIVCGTGLSDMGRNDCWAFFPVSNTWLLKDSVPGNGRKAPATFSINGKGYVCGGSYGFGFGTASLFDFYSFDPLNNTWTALQNFPGLFPRFTSTFSVNGIGYICNGYDGATATNELWAFDSGTNGIEERGQKPYYSSLVIQNSLDMEKINQVFSNVKDNVMVYDRNGGLISNDFLNEKAILNTGIYWFVTNGNTLKVLVLE